MTNQLPTEVKTDSPPVKRKPGRPRKETNLLPDFQLLDTSKMSNDEIVIKLKNQIFTQAMLPSPQSTILSIAVKVFGVSDDVKNDKEHESLTTEELMDRLNKFIPK